MKTKKLLAVLMALVMVLSLGVSVLADGEGGETPASTPTLPSGADTATVTVKNVEAGATVKLYKIVEALYNEYGLNGYAPVNLGTEVTPAPLAIADVKAPTATEIAAIASDATTLGKLAPYTATQQTSGDYTATVPAGTYLVLVSGAGATIYNPMIVSVDYTKNEAPAEGGTVDAKSGYTLNGATAYAKSTTPAVDKKITNPGDSGNVNGSDVAIGDTVNFEIDTAIPSYSDQYNTVVFNVSDTLSEGLTLCADSETGIYQVTVKVDGTEVAPSDDTANTYTLTATDRGFTVAFDSDYIKANGGKKVVVTYSALVNNDATVNYDPNTNIAKITFSNDPTDSSKTGEKTDKTYTYTFAIDGILGATEVTDNYQTHEVIKVDENGKVEVISQDTELLDEIKVTSPLAGATFSLKLNGTDKVYTATSDASGYLDGFTGLDAGIYTLVETSAPEGYVVDPTEHEVEIAAEYNDDGTLKNYSITIDDEETSTYKATYDSTGAITKIEAEGQDTLVIENTKIPQLPSTGGIGTTVFYIIGAVLIIGAGILLITKKRMRDR